VQWLHTGQHDEMARQILSCFEIVPDISLEHMSATLSEFSAGCRQQLDVIMASDGRPSWCKGTRKAHFKGRWPHSTTEFRSHMSRRGFARITSVDRFRKKGSGR